MRSGGGHLFLAAAGAVIGVLSGYLGGIVDEALMRLTDAIMAIPSLLFALMIIAVQSSVTIERHAIQVTLPTNTHPARNNCSVPHA